MTWVRVIYKTHPVTTSKRLTCAAMTRCRSAMRLHLGHAHSLNVHRFLWPFNHEITPWFRHRAHFGRRPSELSMSLSAEWRLPKTPRQHGRRVTQHQDAAGRDRNPLLVGLRPNIVDAVSYSRMWPRLHCMRTSGHTWSKKLPKVTVSMRRTPTYWDGSRRPHIPNTQSL